MAASAVMSPIADTGRVTDDAWLVTGDRPTSAETRSYQC